MCLKDCRERLFGPATNRFDIAKRFICDDRTGDMEANRMNFPQSGTDANACFLDRREGLKALDGGSGSVGLMAKTDGVGVVVRRAQVATESIRIRNRSATNAVKG